MASSSAPKSQLRFVPQGETSLQEDAPGWNPGRFLNQSQQGPPSASPENVSNTTKQTASLSPATSGPLCWKCRGNGTLMPKAKKKKWKKRQDCSASVEVGQPKQEQLRECPVCHGVGHLPPKIADILGSTKPGVITSGRRHEIGWRPVGPLPQALGEHTHKIEPDSDFPSPVDISDVPYWVRWLLQANSHHKSIEVCQQSEGQDQEQEPSSRPIWLPQPGEELCNLVGSWRILQRVGSHRWTTDDLVTAYCAAKAVTKMIMDLQLSAIGTQQRFQFPISSAESFSYLDLGCGNGSVLQMVTWALIKDFQQKKRQAKDNDTSKIVQLQCWGVEARNEAVSLARRSIAFNIGETNGASAACREISSENESGQIHVTARVFHGDFRDVVEQFRDGKIIDDGQQGTKVEDVLKKEKAPVTFDLITGTPPYFRVDFTLGNKLSKGEHSKGNNGKDIVTKAVIRQGGMPTAVQSAPSRCEFRGGIEAYCMAASQVLREDTGKFVVCENWKNHHRVLPAASEAGLHIESILKVHGRVGRETLFAVYVMKKERQVATNGVGRDSKNEPILTKSEVDSTQNHTNDSIRESSIAVRTQTGEWTEDYQTQVLDFMSIPAPPKR